MHSRQQGLCVVREAFAFAGMKGDEGLSGDGMTLLLQFCCPQSCSGRVMMSWSILLGSVLYGISYGIFFVVPPSANSTGRQIREGLLEKSSDRMVLTQVSAISCKGCTMVETR